MQKVMVARGTDGYAFRVIDVAESPMRTIRPRRALIVGGACVLSLLLAIVAVVAIVGVRPAAAGGRAS